MSESSGTQRGYEWAQNNNITEQWQVDSYTGKSESFKRGMQMWVDELKAQQADSEAQKMEQYRTPQVIKKDDIG